MDGIEEKDMLNIAEAIHDHKNLLKLGLNLGFKKPAVEGYIKTNRVDGTVGFKGTCDMLFDWKNKTSKPKQLADLKKALEDANMVELLTDRKLFPQAAETSGAPDKPVETSGASDKPVETSGASGKPVETSKMSAAAANKSASEPVTDDYLNGIVNDLPSENFSAICLKLGWSENHAKNKLVEHLNNYAKTYRAALQDWKNEEGRTIQELNKLLKEARCGNTKK